MKHEIELSDTELGLVLAALNDYWNAKNSLLAQPETKGTVGERVYKQERDDALTLLTKLEKF